MAIIKNPLTLVKQESGGGQTIGEYYARVFDYDGKLLKEERLNNGQKFTMPTPPTHSGLVFDGWSSSQQIINDEITIDNNNFLAGAMYYTSSGKTEFDIELNAATGLDVQFFGYVGKEIDWGDGNTTTPASNNYITHTYSSYGNYTMKCANDLLYSRCFNQNTFINGRFMVKHIRLKSGLSDLPNNCFELFRTLEDISFPSNIKFSISTFGSCYLLKCIICDFGSSSLVPSISGTHLLETISFGYNYTRFAGIYSEQYSLKNFVIPKSVTQFGSLEYCQSLEEMIIPNTVQIVDSRMCYGCQALKKISLSSNATYSSNFLNGLRECYCLEEVTVPSNITKIGSGTFNNLRSAKKIVFLGDMTEFGSQCFNNNYNCLIYDFSHCTTIPTLVSGAFTQIPTICKMLVPQSLYSQWVADTNWAAYSQYIIGV